MLRKARTMKIKEVIEELKKLDQEAVAFYLDGYGEIEITEIKQKETQILDYEDSSIPLVNIQGVFFT
jgi:hypothetical protein